MENTQTTKTIEQKAQGKNFFTKRNIILIVVTTIISLGLVALTFFVIFKPSIWSTFFTNLGIGFKSTWGWAWFIILVLFACFNVMYNMIPFWFRLRKEGLHIKFWEWLCFSLSVSFLKAVTPLNFVYDPYIIFFLSSKGVPVSRASSVMLSNMLIWQIGLFLVNLPSFIIVLVKPWQVAVSIKATLIVFMSIGIALDIAIICLLLLLCFSKNAHYAVSRVFNGIKKRLHMKYHTKEEIIEKYKVKAQTRRDVINDIKDWKSTVGLLLFYIAHEMIVYFTLCAALKMIDHDFYSFNAIAVYHSANMAFNANRFNPIPGFGIGLEYSLIGLLKGLGGIKPRGGMDTFVGQGILLWRNFYTYIPALAGIVGFGVLTSIQIGRYNKRRKTEIKK